MKFQRCQLSVFILWIIMTQSSDGQGRSRKASLIPSTLKFFPEVNNDLSKITWGHAINEQQLLNEAISSESPIMMLEADVSKGHLEGETDTSISSAIPIMSHPPSTTSDTSLKMWIEAVIKANKEGRQKGAKLDFKNTDIMEKSLEIIRSHSAEINFPLWFNADIVRGPGGENSEPIDADIFLSLCSEFFPGATLSVGWTTGFLRNETQAYTPQMMQEMVDVIKRNSITQPLTFPIRASFVSNSLDIIKTLMESFPRETITVWTSSSDDVNLEGLASLQDLVGEDIVYFDISKVEKTEVSNIRARKIEISNIRARKTKNTASSSALSRMCSIPLIAGLLAFLSTFL